MTDTYKSFFTSKGSIIPGLYELQNARAQEGDNTSALQIDIHSAFTNEPALSSHIEDASMNKLKAPHGEVASFTKLGWLLRELPLTTVAEVGAHSLSATIDKRPAPGRLATCSAAQQLQRKQRRIKRRALKSTIYYETRTRAIAEHQSRKRKQSKHQLKQTQPSASTTASTARTQFASTSASNARTHCASSSAATPHAHSLSPQHIHSCAMHNISTRMTTGVTYHYGSEDATSGGGHTPSGGAHTPRISFNVNEVTSSAPEDYTITPTASGRALTASHGTHRSPTSPATSTCSDEAFTGPTQTSSTSAGTTGPAGAPLLCPSTGLAGALSLYSSTSCKDSFDIIDMALIAAGAPPLRFTTYSEVSIAAAKVPGLTVKALQVSASTQRTHSSITSGNNYADPYGAIDSGGESPDPLFKIESTPPHSTTHGTYHDMDLGEGTTDPPTSLYNTKSTSPQDIAHGATVDTQAQHTATPSSTPETPLISRTPRHGTDA